MLNIFLNWISFEFFKRKKLLQSPNSEKEKKKQRKKISFFFSIMMRMCVCVQTLIKKVDIICPFVKKFRMNDTHSQKKNPKRNKTKNEIASSAPTRVYCNIDGGY